MASIAPKRGTASTWRVLLAVLCLVLAVLAGTAQAAHFHADGADLHPDCGLCATAHVSVEVTQTPATAPPVRVAARHEIVEQVSPAARLADFALFTRPPPAA